jgi:hypothetical protein
LQILIALAKIKPSEQPRLEKTLATVAADPVRNPFIRLADSPSTHFARFTIVTDDEHGPRLLLVANYDGGIVDYVKELAAASPRLDDVFGACEGYRGRAEFFDFLADHYCKARGVYIGFPSLTVERIHNVIAVREQVQQFLDLPDVAEHLYTPGIQPFLDLLTRTPSSPGAPARVATAVSEIGANVATAIRGPLLGEYLRLAKWYAALGQDKEPPLVYGECDASAAPKRETEQAIQGFRIGDQLIQNGMTTVTDIRPERLWRLNLALVGTTFLSRFGYPPGTFADVGSLHFFAWAVIDDSKRLIFVSTFDGSWQNYMQDFINKLVWGLDALYANTYGYPGAGMRNIPAFTEYIIGHQFPAQVFYSAYPNETVRNLITDQEIVRALARRPAPEAAARWLELL